MDIEFYRENTVNINLTFPDADITGATVYFTVKPEFDEDPTDANALIQKDITDHTDPANGRTTIGLSPEDTDVTAGRYGYDIKVKLASGEQTTTAVGKCKIEDVYTLRA